MADDGYWLQVGFLLFIIPSLAMAACGAMILALWLCPRAPVGWRRMWLSRLGGISTLEQALDYDCSICCEKMEAGEEVRTLSCGHVFHRGAVGTEDEEDCKGVDHWLTEETMTCPICRRFPSRVPPRIQPPITDLEQLLLPPTDEEAP